MAIDSTKKCEIVSTILEEGKAKLLGKGSACDKLLQEPTMRSLEEDDGLLGKSISEKRLLSPLKIQTKGRPP